jgi:hypothetical protein
MAESINSSVGTVIAVLIMMSIALLAAVILGVVKGQTYQLAEPKITELYSTSYDLTNNSITVSNTSHRSLGRKEVLAILSFRNKTVNNAVPSFLSNFTVNYDNGSVKLVSGAATGLKYNGKKYNVTVSYKNRTMRAVLGAGIVSAFDADKQVLDFTPTMALAVLIIIVLGVIVTLLLNSTVRSIGGNTGGAI